MSKIERVVPGNSDLTLEPYTPNIGAIVHGVDLAAPDPAVHAELRRALADYQVLFFRGQVLSPDQQVAAARIFGDPDKAKAYFPRHDDHPQIERIESRPGGNNHRTDRWHADITFSVNPPTGAVLYAREVPPAGGDTLWTSATRVYDALAPALQGYLEGLEARHSIEHSGWPQNFLARPDGEALYRRVRAEQLPVVHPVVQTHPLTGRKLVYVNPNFTDRILGLNRAESDALLALLFAVFQRPDFQVRWRWQINDVAVWDNRATQHYAVADYAPAPRLMHRVTFGEDRAF
ncbi:MAG: TauD/TfdA family dioxygenase [Azospirillaceae bacterium]|nr:TauD/TfdA family dioxygenase [Azospirillaceae bacterium]